MFNEYIVGQQDYVHVLFCKQRLVNVYTTLITVHLGTIQ